MTTIGAIGAFFGILGLAYIVYFGIYLHSLTKYIRKVAFILFLIPNIFKN